MRHAATILLTATVLLSACERAGPVEGAGPKASGRYVGIGTFSAGRLWGQMAGVDAPADPAAARLEDDEQIIVTIDSHSGEVRQCGDRSGHCVAINPWRGSNVPVRLNKHAADLTADDQASASEEEVGGPAETPAQ